MRVQRRWDERAWLRKHLGFTALLAALALVWAVNWVRADGLSASAQEAMLRGDWANVLEVLEKSDLKDPDVPSRMVAAHACLAKNKNNECFALLLTVHGDAEGVKTWDDWTKRFLIAHSNSAVALHLRADALARIGELTNAIVFCGQAIARDPGFALAYNARAVLLAAVGQTDSALTDLHLALRLNAKLADAHANLGMVSLLLGAVPQDDVPSGFDKALELNPFFALAHNGRGVTLFAKGDFLGAATEFSLASALLPALLVAEVNREVADSYAAIAANNFSDFLDAVTNRPGTTLTKFIQQWEPTKRSPLSRSPADQIDVVKVPLAHLGADSLNNLVKQHGIAAVRASAQDQLRQARIDTFQFGRQIQNELAHADFDTRTATYFRIFDSGSSLAKNAWDARKWVDSGWGYALGKGGIQAATKVETEILSRNAGYDAKIALGAASPFVSWYGGNAVATAANVATKSPLGAAVMSTVSSVSKLGDRLFDDWSYVRSSRASDLAGQQRVWAAEMVQLEHVRAELDNRWVVDRIRVEHNLSPEPPPLRLTLQERSVMSITTLADRLGREVQPGQKVVIAADPFGHQASVLKEQLAWKGIDSVITSEPKAMTMSGRGVGSIVAMSAPEPIRLLLSASGSPASRMNVNDNWSREWRAWWPVDHGSGVVAARLPQFRNFEASTPRLPGLGGQPGGVALDFSRAFVDRGGFWPVTTWFGLAYATRDQPDKEER